jgi:hypothetical protein
MQEDFQFMLSLNPQISSIVAMHVRKNRNNQTYIIMLESSLFKVKHYIRLNIIHITLVLSFSLLIRMICLWKTEPLSYAALGRMICLWKRSSADPLPQRTKTVTIIQTVPCRAVLDYHTTPTL